MAVWKWPAPRAALSWSAAWDTATTKDRSNRSSSGVEARCFSSMSLGRIGSTRRRRLVSEPRERSALPSAAGMSRSIAAELAVFGDRRRV